MSPSSARPVPGSRPRNGPVNVLHRGRLIAVAAVATLGVAACGDGPAAPDYGYEGPSRIGGEAYQDNPKDSVTRAIDPRDLAADIGCVGFTPVFADRVGEILGTCQLQGKHLRVVSFADNEAQQSYLETHRDTGVYVVDDLWAVQAPTTFLAQQVQQRVGGRLVPPVAPPGPKS